jgi:hypothetical protein
MPAARRESERVRRWSAGADRRPADGAAWGWPRHGDRSRKIQTDPAAALDNPSPWMTTVRRYCASPRRRTLGASQHQRYAVTAYAVESMSVRRQLLCGWLYLLGTHPRTADPRPAGRQSGSSLLSQGVAELLAAREEQGGAHGSARASLWTARRNNARRAHCRRRDCPDDRVELLDRVDHRLGRTHRLRRFCAWQVVLGHREAGLVDAGFS